MGLTALGGLRADDDPTALASIGVRRMMALLIVAVRLSSAGIGAVVAIAGMAPPAHPGLVVAGSLLVLVWAALATPLTLRRGLSSVLTGVDVLVVSLLLLAHRWLVPGEVRSVSAGTGWVDVIAGAGVLIAQFGLRQPIGVAVGLLIAAVYVIGDGQIREAPVHLAEEALIAACVVTLLHRAAAAADAALADAAERRHAAIVRAAVRADERNHQRQLHDTVLATLTMVHTGGVAGDSVTLRERVVADLAIIEDLRAHPASGRGSGRPVVRLDMLLRSAVVRPRPGDRPLGVAFDVSPIEVPADVATAMAQCVAEALTNVARHAETEEAHLAGRAEGQEVSVTVSDNGVGFDVTAVPPHRRGLRESIAGRMSSVGGSARVRSGSGAGTQIVLRWPGG
jgi:signal transduction histidine kinase